MSARRSSGTREDRDAVLAAKLPIAVSSATRPWSLPGASRRSRASRPTRSTRQRTTPSMCGTSGRRNCAGGAGDAVLAAEHRRRRRRRARHTHGGGGPTKSGGGGGASVEDGDGLGRVVLVIRLPTRHGAGVVATRATMGGVLAAAGTPRCDAASQVWSGGGDDAMQRLYGAPGRRSEGATSAQDSWTRRFGGMMDAAFREAAKEAGRRARRGR